MENMQITCSRSRDSSIQLGLNVQHTNYESDVILQHQKITVKNRHSNTNRVHMMCFEMVEGAMVLTRHVQQISIAADIMHIACTG